ncbi:Gldg family protein [Lentisphaera marina]|uniref:Gldg family protein n=1 Tax=Lentisphaera marina TaxID=1111041 RepID=UPI0023670D9D|nr:Gldg family protein [Lentisphaera marina]MDD7983701.1 Gldg family protein [Lentisphaera marina]
MSSFFRSVKAISKREYKSYFSSSLAYVFLIAFLVTSAVFSFKIADWYKLNEASMRLLFDFHPYLYLFFIPAVGMRMWSEEDRVGSLELLLTMPVTVWQAVIGKFIAAWAFLATALLLTFPMVVTTYYLGDPDTGRIIAGYGGSLLLGGMCLALCGVCSSLTQNQVTSYICSFLLMLIFMVAGMQQLGIEAVLNSILPKEVVETLIFFSIIPHIASLARGVFDLRDFIYFFSIMLFGLGSTVAILRCRKASHKFNRPITALVIGLVFVSVVILNLIFRNVSYRIDLSEDKLYTLSESSIKVIQQMDSPGRIRFYFSRSTPGVSMEQKALARRVEDLLREYAEESNGKLKLEVIDPQAGTPGETSARFDGLQEIKLGQQGVMYLGVAVSYQDKVMTIPAFTADEEDQMELNVTRLLHSAQKQEKPVVLFQSALPVLGLKADPSSGRIKDEPEWSIITEMRIDYTLLQMPPKVKEIPDKVKMVILVHPETLSEESMYALDQYLMRGGKILCFLDNFSLVEGKFNKGTSQKGRLSQMSTLLGFSEAWGVRYVPEELVADRALKTPVKGKENPFMLSLGPDNLKSDEAFFTNVNKLHIPYAGYLDYRPVEGLKYDVLMESSPYNLGVKRQEALKSREVLQKITAKSDPKILAMRVSGKMKSAFQKYLPNDVDIKKHLKQGTKTGEVILFSDADMLHDSFQTNIQHLFNGRRERVSISDNTVLFLNILDTALNEGSLLGLRGRRFKRRNFGLVYQRQIDEYEAQLDEIESLDLEHAKASRNVSLLESKMVRQLILNPEEKKTLTEKKESRDKADLRLKEIESELKASAQNFEKKVFYWNLYLPPFLVLMILLLRYLLSVSYKRRTA